MANARIMGGIALYRNYYIKKLLIRITEISAR